jgi:hypothetical protein
VLVHEVEWRIELGESSSNAELVPPCKCKPVRCRARRTIRKLWLIVQTLKYGCFL